VGAALLADAGVTGCALPDDLVHEVVRFGASELHAVCAVVGGMAAQEAIKLITSQFVPLTGGLLYNGMTCTTTLTNF
jgi:amyloid beta precursor protein binding protein 1